MPPKAASEKKGGRKQASVAQPELHAAVEAIIANDTAGSPVDQNIRWTNRSVFEIASELRDQGFQIGADALRRVLFDELGLSNRQAYKDVTMCDDPQRDEQFQFIAQLRDEYARRERPVLSIDTKKKEILGEFHHAGRAITDGRVRVQDHDFVSADERLVPYGVYDVQYNEGFMYLSRGSDTSESACDAVRRWWCRMGRRRHLGVSKMLLLCDCGGSNGYRQHRFKEELCRLAYDLDCDIQVAHYPPGCSKYNPIEHRMFCHVTRALQAVTLKTIEVAKEFIGRTHTTGGLRVVAEITRRFYETGLKATREFLESYPIRFNAFLPRLNYTASRLSMLR